MVRPIGCHEVIGVFSELQLTLLCGPIGSADWRRARFLFVTIIICVFRHLP